MRRTMWVPVLLMVGLGVAGCTGSSDGSGSTAQGTVNGDAAAGARAAAPVPGNGASGSAVTRLQANTAITPTGAAKIRTAEVVVSVAKSRDVARRADEATAITLRAGGEVDSDDRNGGKDASASLRLRVPPAELATTLRALARLGTVTSQQQGVRDVTTQVADVTSRIDSAQRAIARLRTLYSDASKVGDVIAVESQLSSREADLESLQAQQRALAGQTSLATITLTLQTGTAPPAKHDERSGFLGGLLDGWDAFVGFLGGVATGIGAALPFLVLAVLLALIGRVAVRRTRAHRRPAAD